MAAKPPFLNIRLRAIAHATESDERVEKAVGLASGQEVVSSSGAVGHFGNPMSIFEVELSRNRDIRDFLKKLDQAGTLAQLKEEAGDRLDQDCVLHIRLDKQKAYKGELELAETRDVIDVCMKVGAYPARYELALENILAWFDGIGN